MSDGTPEPHRPTLPVEVGAYTLEVGDPAGTTIVAGPEHGDPRPLAKALAKSSQEPTPSPPAPDEPTDPIETVEQVTDKVQHALDLFNDLAAGSVDLESIAKEADALLALLERLDRDHRWADALRVARVLCSLLALLSRWLELLRSLRLALSLAERLPNENAKAWALHELGTLHLAAEKYRDADDMLTQAHQIRERARDRPGMTATGNNLQVVCRALRARLHESRWRQFQHIPNARTIAAIIVVSLIVVGGAAGAVIHGSGGTHPAVSLKISFAPTSPRPGERIRFHVTTNTTADPYAWWFGDGASSSFARPTHVYKHSGRYLAILTVTNKRGAVVGNATQLIVVKKPPPHPPHPPKPKPTVKRPQRTTKTIKPSPESSSKTSKATGKVTGFTVNPTEKQATTKTNLLISRLKGSTKPQPTTTGESSKQGREEGG